MTHILWQTKVEHGQDTVIVRQHARTITALLGMEFLEQTKVMTAISEIVRNAWDYAGGATVTFSVDEVDGSPALLIRVEDTGPGFADSSPAHSGPCDSPAAGMGIRSARRLMDRFELQTSPHGTVVTMSKIVPLGYAASTERIEELAREALRAPLEDPIEELRRQNHLLARTLGDLSDRQDELTRLTLELEETNSGVVALYAELEDAAERLKVADELKSRFLSNASHEFRGPVNSIVALSRILLDRSDGPLTDEQTKQVAYIFGAAEGLHELVNDLLDLAKVEAGMITLHPDNCHIPGLMATLRGMARPLATNPDVNMVFEVEPDIPDLYTDESKVAQILRNFVSNAMKFTVSGEIRTRARLGAGGTTIIFSVEDTGIGIPPEDLDNIFHEFVQIESRLQRRVEGSGLGLPLSRKLAELLGGSVLVESELGRGSVFSLVLPLALPCGQKARDEDRSADTDMRPLSLLLIGSETSRFEPTIREAGFRHIRATSVDELRTAIGRHLADGIFVANGDEESKEEAWRMVRELHRLNDPNTEEPISMFALVGATDVPTAREIGIEYRENASGTEPWLYARLRSLADRVARRSVLVVDDTEIDRYVVKELLPDDLFHVIQAESGSEALHIMESRKVDVAVVDFAMPDMDGIQVLDALRDSPGTHALPFILCTTQSLDESQLEHLRAQGAVYLPKSQLATDTLTQAIDALVTSSKR